MKINKILKINLLVGLVTLVVHPAFAMYPVYDAALNRVTAQGFIATNTELSALNTTNVALNAYLMGGTTGGNGLVENTASINEKLAQLVAKSNNDWTQQATQLRAALSQLEMSKASINAQPLQGACEDASAAGGRGETSSIAAATKRAIVDAKTTENTQQPSGAAQAAALVMYKVSKGYCTAGESKLNTANCTSAGTLAGADIEASSLMSGAVASNSGAVLSNHTFTDTQLKAANDYQSNLLGESPEQLDSKTNQTAAGRVYAGYSNIYQARQGAALDFLSGIEGDNKPANGSSDVWTNAGKESWSTTESEWNSMFPGVQWPASNPSAHDRLDFEVDRFYSSPLWNTYYKSGLDEKALLAEGLKMKAIQMHLQLLQYRNSQETNLLLSALLSQSLNPITTTTLKNSAQEAYTRQEAN